MTYFASTYINDVSGNTIEVVEDESGNKHLGVSVQTSSSFKYIGTDATTVCKDGSGKLCRIIIINNVGQVIAYDNTLGTGDVICNIDAARGSEPLGSIEFGCDFSNGLTIVNYSGSTCTVIYE